MPRPISHKVWFITGASKGFGYVWTEAALARGDRVAAVEEHSRALGLAYPPGVFSLSHVALSFPLSDSLYGMQPDPAENFGVNLSAVARRGERGTLIVNLDALLRMSSNPSFPYMIERIEEGIRGAAAETPIKATTPP